MLGRAVTAFRNSVTKSKSSSTLDEPNDGDDDCGQSVVSSFSSSSITSSASQRLRGEAIATSTPKANRLSFLRRSNRSRSTNREGEASSPLSILVKNSLHGVASIDAHLCITLHFTARPGNFPKLIYFVGIYFRVEIRTTHNYYSSCSF